jgi:hypothetical protein
LTATSSTDTPSAVAPLLAEFQDLFWPSEELPPRRQQDHQIPLIPGAHPVNVRPYRYAPHQKDEIERQIHHMLRLGIIRHSSSPFASPVLLSDRDKIFTSALWKELFRLTDTQLMMSSAYHPQTDGQTERLNQCLESYLPCTVHTCPNKWFHWLPLAEFWYNTAFHTAIGCTPFEAIYGQPPRHFGISAAAACAVADLDYWLQERESMTALMKQHLLQAK